MGYLKNLKWEMIIYAILGMALGVWMWARPLDFLMVLRVTLALILIIMGIRYIVEYRRKNAPGGFYLYSEVLGIVLIVAGIAVFVFMKSILSIATYAVAVIIIISAVAMIESAIDLKKMRCHWIPMLVFAIICILLGLSVLIMPMNQNDDGTRTAGEFMIQCSGVILLATSLIELIATLMASGKIHRWYRELKN